MFRNCWILLVLLAGTGAKSQEGKSILNSSAVKSWHSYQTMDSLSFEKFLPTFTDEPTVIGLGEPIHGAMDFDVMRTRVLEYLIKQKGLKIILIETSMVDGMDMNRYIHTGQHFCEYWNQYKSDTLIGFLKWLKDYNENKNSFDKVQIYGIDITKIWSLKPEAELFQILGDSAYQFTKHIDSLRAIWSKRQLNKLLDQFAGNYAKTLDSHQYKQLVLKNLVLSLRCHIEMKDRNWPKGKYHIIREELMAKNVIQIIDMAPPSSKNGVILAHNGHITKKGFYRKSLGELIKDKVNYYVIGGDFEMGKISAIDMSKVNKYRDTFIRDSQPFSLAYQLSGSNKGILFMNFDNNRKNRDKFYLRHSSIYYSKEAEKKNSRYYYQKNELFSEFDGYIIIKNVSPGFGSHCIQ